MEGGQGENLTKCDPKEVVGHFVSTAEAHHVVGVREEDAEEDDTEELPGQHKVGNDESPSRGAQESKGQELADAPAQRKRMVVRAAQREGKGENSAPCAAEISNDEKRDGKRDEGHAEVGLRLEGGGSVRVELRESSWSARNEGKERGTVRERTDDWSEVER